METEIKNETTKEDSGIKTEQEKDVLSTEGKSYEQPEELIGTETNENESGRQAEQEDDSWIESQERPSWWSDEIGELRQTFVASRKLLKKERKKATKTMEELMVDMAYAAYQHDKVVLKTAVAQAKARYEKLDGRNKNVERTT